MWSADGSPRVSVPPHGVWPPSIAGGPGPIRHTAAALAGLMTRHSAAHRRHAHISGRQALLPAGRVLGRSEYRSDRQGSLPLPVEASSAAATQAGWAGGVRCRAPDQLAGRVNRFVGTFEIEGSAVSNALGGKDQVGRRCQASAASGQLRSSPVMQRVEFVRRHL